MNQPPPLIKEAWDYLAGRASKAELINLIRETRASQVNGEVWGESNQKLSFMISPLVEAFPDAKFIWLVRNGAAVAASFEHRRAYRRSRGEWNTYRPSGDAFKDMPPGEWAAMSPFAKCCWYWAFTNRKIREGLLECGRPWILVRLEEIQHEFGAVATFLGVTVPASHEVPKTNASRGTVTAFHYWDHRQREEFRRYCGDVMDELYPGWNIETSTFQKIRNEFLAQLSYRTPIGKSLRLLLPCVPKPLISRVRPLFTGRGVLNFNDG